MDTSVLACCIARDDEAQALSATRLIEDSCTRKQPGFLSLLVLAELFWVLSRGDGYPKATVVAVHTKLLSSTALLVADYPLAWAALRAEFRGFRGLPDRIVAFKPGMLHLVHFRNTGGAVGPTYAPGIAKSAEAFVASHREACSAEQRGPVS